jgi:hypothetical protein
MYNLCRVLKTGILAVLTVMSGLGDSCLDDDDSCVLYMFIIYYLNTLHYLCHIDREIVGTIQSSCYTCGVRYGLTLTISPILLEMF